MANNPGGNNQFQGFGIEAPYGQGAKNTELLAFVQEQADKAVRAGVRKIDGFEIEEVRVI